MSQATSLALILNQDRELVDLRRQRERAQNEGNITLVAELSIEILNRVEHKAAAIAADVKLRTNEQIKYGCTLVNTMAASIFTAGVAAPVIGIFAPGSIYADNPLLLGEVSGGCFIITFLLHMVVRAMLRGLRA